MIGLSNMPMVITAFKDESYTVPASVYSFMLNPENFKDSYAINYSDVNTLGSVESARRFQSVTPRTVSFDTVIDATGVVSKIRRVLNAEILLLKKTVYDYSGTTHSPPFLQIVWGTALIFKCRLKNMNIEYTYFNSFGLPMRAKVSMTFEQWKPCNASAKNADSSPDMTHEITVKPGDTLPVLCQDVYGDESRYMQVAESNGLNDFRNLKPGSRLVFPPVK